MPYNPYGKRNTNRRQTPNEPNETDAYRYISEAPTANRESGVYEAGQTVRVKLAAAGDIYYTTDGSAPTEESTPYTLSLIHI